MSNNYKIHHGIKLSDNSKIYNLEIEELDEDPNPIRLGRIWYNKPEKNYKHTTLDKDNNVIIKSFQDISFISNTIPSTSDSFILPAGISVNEAIDLLTAQINLLINKINNLILTEYFYTTDIPTNSIDMEIPLVKYKLSISINGLEQSNTCFNVDNNRIIFNDELPNKSLIKVIYFNI